MQMGCEEDLTNGQFTSSLFIDGLNYDDNHTNYTAHKLKPNHSQPLPRYETLDQPYFSNDFEDCKENVF